MRYDIKTKLKCRAMFVEVDGRKTPQQISDALNGTPSKAQVLNWAKETDDDGLTWYDYQRQADEQFYAQITPAERARKIEAKINALLVSGESAGALGDAIQKLAKSYQIFVDPRLQYGVIFQTLDDLMTHVETKFISATVENRVFFADVLRSFRNEVKER